MRMGRWPAVAILVCMVWGGHAQDFEPEFMNRGRPFREQADTSRAMVTDTSRVKPQKLKVVKRSFDYREQIGIALGMMAFILVMMTSAQEWNPR